MCACLDTTGVGVGVADSEEITRRLGAVQPSR
jgi:hypothetical protein